MPKKIVVILEVGNKFETDNKPFEIKDLKKDDGCVVCDLEGWTAKFPQDAFSKRLIDLLQCIVDQTESASESEFAKIFDDTSQAVKEGISNVADKIKKGNIFSNAGSAIDAFLKDIKSDQNKEDWKEKK